ncbi:MAG: phosphate ABC transporter permease subunit PstC [Planctomycetaceae bacterium]|nr:phosphate ABC transporter permease subunit PstC [Planctomycetaceae bacterium]
MQREKNIDTDNKLNVESSAYVRREESLSDSGYCLKAVVDFVAFQIFARLANLVMVVVLAIFVFIFYRSIPFLFSFDGGLSFSNVIDAFTSRYWYPDAEPPHFGMLSLFYGSFIVTFLAMLFAVPIGILSAVVLSDMIPFRFRQALKPLIELPAAIPSVAFGFFAIKIVAPFLQDTFGFTSGTNALNAALILAIMAIPTIVSVAEDAMSGLGRELREASYALGATRTETIIHVVCPAAWNGIAAAIILGIMRAIGETMVVWMAAGNAANMPDSWFKVDQVINSLTNAVKTMTATIASDIGETPADSLHRSALFAVGLFLLLFTFAMNLLSEYITSKNRLKFDAQNKTSDSTSRKKSIFRNITFVLMSVTNIFVRIISFAINVVIYPPQLLFRLLLGDSKLLRYFLDFGFTCFSYLSILILFLTFGIVIVPIFKGGMEAVYFQETVEHRLFLLEKFQRGSSTNIISEFRECVKARQPVYDTLKKLSWLMPDDWIAQAAQIGRNTEANNAPNSAAAKTVNQTANTQPDNTNPNQQPANSKNRKLIREFRNLCCANSTDQLNAAFDKINELRKSAANQFEPLFKLSDEYYQIARDADLSLRDKSTQIDPNLTYAEAYKQIRTLVTGVEGTGCILGPESRDSILHLPTEVRFGATHWSTAEKYFSLLKHTSVWQPRHDEAGNVLINEEVVIDRVVLFRGTTIEPDVQFLINTLSQDMPKMLNPQRVFYVNYFFDSATAGHYIGGVGPELFGTALISFLSILISLPLGVLTAAYLIEVAKDNWLTRSLRLCINTLAGVPSIVFGLFGLAMIVEFIIGKPSLLAGAITLSLLILPVVIRTSEEAIRAVPQAYREAAVGLGAGSLWTFLSVTLPVSLPGILTGVILGISRAAGETAPLLFTCAVASGGFISGSNILFQPTPVLSYSAYDMAVGDRIASIVPYNQFGLVSTLILFVLIFNIAAITLRARITSNLRGT